jgi:hypothetical protein
MIRVLGYYKFTTVICPYCQVELCTDDFNSAVYSYINYIIVNGKSTSIKFMVDICCTCNNYFLITGDQLSTNDQFIFQGFKSLVTVATKMTIKPRYMVGSNIKSSPDNSVYTVRKVLFDNIVLQNDSSQDGEANYELYNGKYFLYCSESEIISG